MLLIIYIYQLHYTFAMLTQEVQEMFVNNRNGQKAHSSTKINNNMQKENNYPELMISVFDVRFFLRTFAVLSYFSKSFIFQYCEGIGLSQSTTYLAKIYLDIVLQKSNFNDSTNLSLLSLTCIWLAIKFNEPAMISQQFNTELICYQGQYSFTTKQLIDTQIQILHLLEYRLRYTTPYDYIHPFFQSFPWFMGSIKAFPDLIKMTADIIQMSYESSENIFYGVFLAICELKKCTLKPLQQNILRSQIRDINRVTAIRRVLVQKYNQIINLQEGMENQQKHAYNQQ